MGHLQSCAALLNWPLSGLPHRAHLLKNHLATTSVNHRRRHWMTWTLFNLQLFLIQLLQDSGPAPQQEPPSKTWPLVSQLWLQGTFYNLTPDETDFFTFILYIILHPNEHCSSSDSSNHRLGAFRPSPWLASPRLSNHNFTLNLSPCYRPSNCLPSGLTTYPSSFRGYCLHC